MRIFCVDRSGTVHELDGSDGASLMELLREAACGIDAICGGGCACGTCHVHVELPWVDKLPPRDEDENALLQEQSSFICEQSRLSCQIRLTPELDGLRVRVAPEE